MEGELSFSLIMMKKEMKKKDRLDGLFGESFIDGALTIFLMLVALLSKNTMSMEQVFIVWLI